MIRVEEPMEGGVRWYLGYTAEDHSKLVFGKAALVEIYEPPAGPVREIVVLYRATRTELMRALAEQGLVGPETEISKGEGD